MRSINEPIIVTGTGRSGTSTVAGILYHLGVHMGEDFIQPNRRNPHGYFENTNIVYANKQYALGEISQDKLQRVLLKESRTFPWGFKDPRVLDMPDVYANIFPYATYIVVKRDKASTLRSLKKTYTPQEAEDIYERRTQAESRLPARKRHTVYIDLLCGMSVRIFDDIVSSSDTQKDAAQAFLNDVCNSKET